MSLPSASPPTPPQPDANPSAASPAPPRRTPRILIIDDDLINQRVVANLLKRKGWDVALAPSGNEGLKQIATGTIDLVLLDLQMPRMDGFETAFLTRQQEAERARRRIPIVALTALRDPATRDRCFSSGMDEHLTKPIKPDELYSVIQRLLQLPS
jgi:CheY-like chemotaxis protein